ncbi:hypothetical protein BpHYR1_023967 [Brachionus plicatilis]|uniref:Uncharacterized protein n=1 Tax=Brachionus plicatilis TaxID=10195 RepID=A0A3M7SPP0_BRAPC|nr:hypothetical protein BpHYR1_023967 [Brachionus plicatilis]
MVLRNSRLEGRPLFVQKPPSWFKLMSGKLKSPATRRLLDGAKLHRLSSQSAYWGL